MSILIIGGGPAGLGAAIEAKLVGAEVTIVDKRTQYTREQYFFLPASTLNILDKWKVTIPDYYIGCDVDNELIGVVKIKNFEEALDNRVKELGIPKVFGEFVAIREGKAIILQNGQELEMPYDLLVGADGEHSRVRQELDIEVRQIENAVGFIAILDRAKPLSAFRITN